MNEAQRIPLNQPCGISWLLMTTSLPLDCLVRLSQHISAGNNYLEMNRRPRGNRGRDWMVGRRGDRNWNVNSIIVAFN